MCQSVCIKTPHTQEIYFFCEFSNLAPSKFIFPINCQCFLCTSQMKHTKLITTSLSLLYFSHRRVVVENVIISRGSMTSLSTQNVAQKFETRGGIKLIPEVLDIFDGG